MTNSFYRAVAAAAVHNLKPQSSLEQRADAAALRALDFVQFYNHKQTAGPYNSGKRGLQTSRTASIL
jgi:hypothetical protein